MDGMKSNRKFKQEDEAVSAVIGVILMVAITVAIAATVYVYVSGMIGGGNEATPSFSFNKLESDDQLLVATADSGIDWSDVNITVDEDYSEIELNGNPYEGGASCPTEWGQVTAGDKLQFASGGENVTIRYIPTNSLLGSWKFS
jgi:flagellin-like protein